MLDAIRQQIATETAGKLSGVPRPNPDPSAKTDFGKVLFTPADTERAAPSPRRSNDDPGELGIGWRTSDVTDRSEYEEPSSAAASRARSAESESSSEPSEGTDARRSQETGVEGGQEDGGVAPVVMGEQALSGAAVLERLQPVAPGEAQVDQTADQRTAGQVIAESVEVSSSKAVAPANADSRQLAAEAEAVRATPAAVAGNDGLDEPAEVHVGAEDDDAAVGKPVGDAGGRMAPAPDAGRLTRPTIQAELTPAGREKTDAHARPLHMPVPFPSSETPTQDVPTMPAVEIISTGPAGGDASGRQAVALDGMDLRVAADPMEPARSNSTAPAADTRPDDLPAPNIDHLAAQTVRWRHLGVLGEGGSARIRLDPPSLGSIDVMLRTNGSMVRVELTVESEAVRHLLQNHSDRLAQSLQNHGLQTGRIQVTVGTAEEAFGEPPGDGQGAGQNPHGRQDDQGGDGTFQQEIEEQLNITV